MNTQEIKVMRDFIRCCDDGWKMGWHERNGGNLTYRLKDEEIRQLRPHFTVDQPWVNMGIDAENLAGEFFIATGSGKYFRNVRLAPQDNLCILEINNKADSWRIVWGLESGGRPTSEFPSHFMNHSVRKEATSGINRVIYHAHPTALIALTYILPLEAREFTRILWQSATECPVIFPGGVGVVPWMVPGGLEIAAATSRVMEEFEAAVWAHHGLFCSGSDFDTTFGLMHTIEKASDIYLHILNSGQPIRQTIDDRSLQAIADAFGVRLKEGYLNL